MPKPLMIFFWLCVILAAAGGIVYLLLDRRRRLNVEKERDFCKLLISRLRKSSIQTFDFNQLIDETGVSRHIACRAAIRYYSQYCERFFTDVSASDLDQRSLRRLRQILSIDADHATMIENETKESHYRKVALAALDDGTITNEEAEDLIRLRKRLALSSDRAVEIMGDSAEEKYLELFQRVISDGRITNEELQELKRYRSAIGLSTKTANSIVRDDAMKLYRQWFCNIIEDGRVTPEEEEGLNWLCEEFGLDSPETRACQAQLQVEKRLSSYRDGNLPSRKTAKLLEGGEICHWEGDCSFQWETTTTIRDAPGYLLVTSRRLIFSSQVKSFALAPSKIVDVDDYDDCVAIECSAKVGTGEYVVEDSRELEAILIGLVRGHKYHTAARYSSSQSRHIPDDVRREVWQRDGGKCVQCGAQDYLEFDHIIPRSRGGASTVKNLQILCRRHNNQKKDRI